MSHILTVIDTSGIQSYIFGSNRLREHVGASEIVMQATGQWIWETLINERLHINNKDVNPHERDDSKTMESGKLDAEVLYTAGGNAVILFADKAIPESTETIAHRWARRLSERALREAPGLTLFVAHSQPFEWNPTANDLPRILRTIFEKDLDQLKRLRIPDGSVLGLGVTASCQSTGLVATTIDTLDQIRISRETASKVSDRYRLAARTRFNKLLEHYTGSNYLAFDPVDELDDLNPNKGQKSYIAVVHIDGNGMGEKFKNVWGKHQNRAGITALRMLSDNIMKAGAQALVETLAQLIDVDSNLIKPYKQHFPIRPLIYGGDDITFVCDGRIGLGLAARYLYEFEQATTKCLGEKITAAAGIAIVKTHYPFARAYELSESLCSNAKKQSHEISTMDWHIATSGLLSSISEIRSREYSRNQGSTLAQSTTPDDLTMRPVFLLPQTNEWRTWTNVETVLRALIYNISQGKANDEPPLEWAGKRNKIKHLREVLRGSDAEITQFRTIYQMGLLPGYDGITDLREKGWQGGRCGYFDPIEILDMYVPPASSEKDGVKAPWVPTL